MTRTKIVESNPEYLGCFFFLLTFCLSNAQPSQELFLSTSKFSSLPHSPNSTAPFSDLYKFNLPPIITYSELIILVVPSSKFSEPVLSLSQNVSGEYKNMDNCYSYDIGVCSVFMNILDLNASLDIAVTCYQKCSYTIALDPSYLNETILLNQRLLLHFTTSSSHIMTFFLQNLKADEHILISASPLNPGNVEKTFVFFAKQGNFIPSSADFDYIPYPIWNEGKGISISSLSPSTQLHEQSNYTILLESIIGTQIMLQVYKFSKMREIRLGETIQDIIESNEIQFFILEVNGTQMRANFSLNFILKPFSGNPDLYVHYDTQPEDLELWQWKTLEDEFEGIEINAAELTELNATATQFYIAVKGKRAGGFSFQVLNSTYDSNVIGFSETLTGELMKEESVNYRFGLRKSENGVIAIETKVRTGNVSVYVKLCCEQENCTIKNKNDSFMKSEENNMVKSLRFRYKGDECISNFSIAYFAIMIKGESAHFSRYSLSLRKAKQSIPLEENEIYRGNLNVKEAAYFSYLVLNNYTIETLHLQVNLIFGDAHIFFSQMHQFPNSSFSNISTEYRNFFDITFQKEDITKGVFYIGIEAKTSLDFTILILTERVDRAPTYIKLNDGQPTKLQFENEQQRFYFQVLNNPSCKKVFFNLKPIWGFFTGYVIEVHEDENWKDPSNSNYDHIVSEEEGLTVLVNQSTLSYRLMVEIDQNYKTNTLIMNNNNAFQFSIMYTSCFSIEDLTFGEVKHLQVMENQRKFLRIKYTTEEFINIITRTEAIHQEFYFWGSLSSNKMFPSFSLHDFQLNSSNYNLTLRKKDFTPYCSSQSSFTTMGTNSTFCSLFLSVESSVNDLSFSVLILRDFSPIRLGEGFILSMPILNKQETLHFFYEIVNKAPISIFYTSFAYNLPLYALVNRMFIYPNSTHNSYMSTGSQQMFTELIIPFEFLNNEECFNDSSVSCFLLITIEALELINPQTSFKISVSSNMIPLTEGHPLVSSVAAGIMKYFSLTIIDKKTESFLISLNSIGEGDLILVVSKGLNSVPTLLRSFWSFETKKTSFINITSNSIEGRLKGTYILGVYSDSNCEFIIDALVSKSVQAIYPGITLFFQNFETQYLEYHQIGNDSFKIILLNLEGNSSLFMNPYKNEKKDFVGMFPNETNLIWKNHKEFIVLDKNDEHFCSDCYYLMTLSSAWENNSKCSILIEKENKYSSMTNGRDFPDFVNTGNQNLYSFRTINDYLELSATLISGDLEIYVGNLPIVKKNSTEWVYKYTRNMFFGNHLDIELGKQPEIVKYSTNHSEMSQKSKTYYILIFGVSSANYSLRFTGKNQRKVLRFGVTDYSVLRPNETQNYEFSTEDSSKEPYTILIVFPNDRKHNYNKQIEANLTGFGYKNDKYFEFPIEIESTSIRNNSILFKFSYQSLYYYLNLTHLSHIEDAINYTLIINNKEAEIIDSGAEGRLMILGLNLSHSYELFSPEEKTVLIEVIECYGKVKLRGTQDYLKTLNDKKFDWEFGYPNDNSHILARYDIHEGPIFLKVTAIDVYNTDAMYFMRSFLVNKGQKIPQEEFLPGNDGVFNWTILNDAKNGTMLIVDFFTIHCIKNCNEQVLKGYNVFSFMYTLHITKEDKLIKETARCDLSPSTNQFYKRSIKEFESKNQTKMDTFRVNLETDGIYFINIVGEVWGFSQEINDYQGFKILYRQQEISIGESHENMSIFEIIKANEKIQIGLIALLTLFLFVLICCCYYRKKRKILENKVYELNQVKEAEGGIFEEKTGDLKKIEKMKLFSVN